MRVPGAQAIAAVIPRPGGRAVGNLDATARLTRCEALPWVRWKRRGAPEQSLPPARRDTGRKQLRPGRVDRSGARNRVGVRAHGRRAWQAECRCKARLLPEKM